jgi:hypothetical protein
MEVFFLPWNTDLYKSKLDSVWGKEGKKSSKFRFFSIWCLHEIPTPSDSVQQISPVFEILLTMKVLVFECASSLLMTSLDENPDHDSHRRPWQMKIWMTISADESTDAKNAVAAS